jgi:Acyl-CoA thioesterase C-terminal domain/Acyl-CoA thioesterase N-terminal domain
VADDPIAEHRALFVRDGDPFLATDLTRGPWSPDAMHGGAPSALLAYVLAHHDPGPADFIARLTVELMRPVPLAALSVVARTIRPGKKVQWLEGSIFADSNEVARATALRVCTQDVDVSDTISPIVERPPLRTEGAPPAFAFFDRSEIGYWSANEIVLVDGAFGVAGPATAWIRLRCPVVEGVPVAPFERVAAAADFGSGIGNPLTFVRASAINPEVTIHTFRHPVGEWVCLQSGGHAAAHGAGLAVTNLYDDDGLIGLGAQSLLVSPVADQGRPGFAPRSESGGSDPRGAEARSDR